MRFASIIRRDSMNYQAYDWPFNEEAAPTSSSDEENDPWESDNNIGTCVGEACCSDGQTYDESLDQCVGESTVESTESFITESMVNDVLTKGSNKYKTDVTLNGDQRVKPSRTESFINFKM
jgi:hypothetical protein